MPEGTVVSNPEPDFTPTQKPGRLRSIIWPLLLLVALLIIAGIIFVWKPWNGSGQENNRTITVSGEAHLQADPDQFTFNPSYQFKNADQKAALDAATTKVNGIVAQLKKLGVADDKIRTNTNGFGSFYDSEQQSYFADITIEVDNKTLAQKVQDYLLTTTPDGSVTPTADFSDAKRKELTDKGRDQATKDARAKAEQSAKNLGFKLGKVKTFTDTPNSGLPIRFEDNVAAGATADSAAGAKTSPIQAGQNDITYEVSVTYFVK